MKRKRGRPKRFQGVKDAGHHLEGLDRDLKAVCELLWELRWSQAIPESKGVDRYQETLATVAARNALSPRTLERRCVALRSMATPIVDLMWEAMGSDRRVVVEFQDDQTIVGRLEGQDDR